MNKAPVLTRFNHWLSKPSFSQFELIGLFLIIMLGQNIFITLGLVILMTIINHFVFSSSENIIKRFEKAEKDENMNIFGQ